MDHRTENIGNIGKEKKEHVIGKIILFIFFSLLMPTIAGVVIGVKEINNQGVIYFIQFLSIFIGCLILIVIIKKSSFTFRQIGFRKGSIGIWILGVIAVEIVALVAGIHIKIDLKGFAYLILFMVSVGFFEEIIYRGFLLQYLKRRNPKTAVVVSALLFGVGHIVNVLGGADVKMTVAQIVFAFLFGIVTAEIAFLTNSIVIGIVWHALHNIIDHITSSPSLTVQFQIVLVQCVILGILGVILWKKNSKTI